MNRNVKNILLLIMVLALLSGCKQKMAIEEITEIPAAPTSAQVQDSLQEMMDRSIAVQGNNYRLNKVLDKMASGEEVKIGFIGGSITEGYNAPKGKNYADLVTQYLDTTYSDGSGKVQCVNAGLAGTPSMLGLIRADRELLQQKPDLIFIEFAVNDAQSFQDRQAFESLVRKCLMQEHAPAVMLLFSVTENGYCCQNDMAMTAFYYDLPAISVKDAIQPEIEAGLMKWSDWSDDDVHPHQNGHRLYSLFICHLIETMLSQEKDTGYEVPAKARFGNDWSALQEYDADNLQLLQAGSFVKSSVHPDFQSSYSYFGKKHGENGDLSFEITGNALFLVYKVSPNKAYGTAEVLIDGQVFAHLSAYDPNSWNQPVAQMIYCSKENETHEVTIRMKDAEEENKFDLLSVGVVCK